MTELQLVPNILEPPSQVVASVVLTRFIIPLSKVWKVLHMMECVRFNYTSQGIRDELSL